LCFSYFFFFSIFFQYFFNNHLSFKCFIDTFLLLGLNFVACVWVQSDFFSVLCGSKETEAENWNIFDSILPVVPTPHNSMYHEKHATTSELQTQQVKTTHKQLTTFIWTDLPSFYSLKSSLWLVSKHVLFWLHEFEYNLIIFSVWCGGKNGDRTI
jgi:hypothetical protein